MAAMLTMASGKFGFTLYSGEDSKNVEELFTASSHFRSPRSTEELVLPVLLPQLTQNEIAFFKLIVCAKNIRNFVKNWFYK